MNTSYPEPEPAPDWVEAIVAANQDFEVQGWCLHCSADRLMVNAISKPCRGCGAEFGLVAGPDHLRPPRPAEVGIETPTGTVHQPTLFDA
jgi:hypothetical protein